MLSGSDREYLEESWSSFKKFRMISMAMFVVLVIAGWYIENNSTLPRSHAPFQLIVLGHGWSFLNIYLIRGKKKNMLKWFEPVGQEKVDISFIVDRYRWTTMLSMILAGSIALPGVVMFILGIQMADCYIFVGLAWLIVTHFWPKKDELFYLAEKYASSSNTTLGGRIVG